MDRQRLCRDAAKRRARGVFLFFCYSVNLENNNGFLKFVIIDRSKRGMGYGREMLRLALQYVFQITGAKAVWLNVFYENLIARQCYEKVGFTEKNIEKDAFAYKDELWSRCSMSISKQVFSFSERAPYEFDTYHNI